MTLRHLFNYAAAGEDWGTSVMQSAPLCCTAFLTLHGFHFLVWDVSLPSHRDPVSFDVFLATRFLNESPFMSSDNHYTRTLGTFSNFSKRVSLM